MSENSEASLISEVGIDYNPLKELLEKQNWASADEWTRTKILWMACCNNIGFLRDIDVDNIPCKDLKTIDLLWSKYSNHRFGFTAQNQIWKEVNKDVEIFVERIGWRVNGKYRTHKEMIFELRAPKGHFPLEPMWKRFFGSEEETNLLWPEWLTEKMEKCGW
ncbi:MAG: GUN4 domain-containing protein [Microcystis aeruginosa W11-06]|jgi:hypothetical protein|nr:GUN4 domain-containing protein [Microcystis aeruginosa W11-03]NCR92850.1 GUN4 domain-containing protein [Microcystis aeruginosa W11-06]